MRSGEGQEIDQKKGERIEKEKEESVEARKMGDEIK